ncbi:hypothetical protein ACINWC743_A0190 [Acinetobacter sp. WC-743]|nr:hypothetical protein ACINWC743_A0190 [Acinetobacter sp. WC-743]
MYRRLLEYGLGITAVSKVFYSVANFIYLAIHANTASTTKVTTPQGVKIKHNAPGVAN